MTAEKRAEPTPAYLAPCPFCGEQPTTEPWHGGGPNKLAVICESVNCFVGPMVTGESNQEAVTRWNWRAVKPDTAAEHDQQRDQLRQTVIDGEKRCIELLEERDQLKAANAGLRERVAELEKLAIDDQSGKSWRSIVLNSEFQDGEVDRIASDYLNRAEAAEAKVAELKAKKWEVQHTDTMNEIVQLGLARDASQAHATELARALEAVRKQVHDTRYAGLSYRNNAEILCTEILRIIHTALTPESGT